jgi:hypothetical protein
MKSGRTVLRHIAISAGVALVVFLVLQATPLAMPDEGGGDPRPHIMGSVRDPNGTVLPNIDVIATDSRNGKRSYETTDYSGWYDMVVDVGGATGTRFTVSSDPCGYLPYSAVVYVRTGSTRLDIVLTRDPTERCDGVTAVLPTLDLFLAGLAGIGTFGVLRWRARRAGRSAA